MADSIGKRLKNAWNAFLNRSPTREFEDVGPSYYYRPDRPRFTRGNDRSIVTSVFNRIALDCASVDVRHVQLDDNKRYLSDVDSGLNNCLNVEANLDQTGRAFIQDVVMSLLDEGVIAIVPTDTLRDPYRTESYDILKLRTGKILEWHPKHVKVRLYNENDGNKHDILLPKTMVSIIENPLFSVMNEPNSTLQRLLRKLALLDVVDEQNSSGKLDLIIQLPYIIKTAARQKQAEERRRQIEEQLAGSKYGIAYTDGTEKITQLNRAIESNLQSQVEYLTNLLYSQLGITQGVLDGSADERTMLNYYNRIIDPIMSAISEEMERKFLTKNARTRLQAIKFFKDPFRLVTVNEIANVASVFTQNEIMTSNEVRQIIGMKPSGDPEADELRNKNLSKTREEAAADATGAGGDIQSQQDSIVEDLIASLEGQVDSIVSGATGPQEGMEEEPEEEE